MEQDDLNSGEGLHSIGASPVRHDAVLSHEYLPARCPDAARPSLLVLLHGFGSNEGDLQGLVPYLDERLNVVSVRGPLRIAAGAYGWYRVSHTAGGPIVHQAEEQESRLLLSRFLDEMIERYGIHRERIFLLGFSQGATLALSFALTVPHQVAGTIAMSGRVMRELPATMAPRDGIAGVRVFMGHGLHDDVVPIGRARASRAFLSELNVDLTYREYPAAHQILPAMVLHAGQWLSGLLDCQK